MPKDTAYTHPKPRAHQNAQAGPSKFRNPKIPDEAEPTPRTQGKRKAGGAAGASQNGKRRRGGGIKPPATGGVGGGGMGVSKIKASLRQTRRLLAREDLEPGLRLKTERRLHSLQQDLIASSTQADSSLANAEEKVGGKGKKAEKSRMRFFERQKLMRLNRRYSKAILLGKKHAAENLEKARVMLHYVHLFPANEKYISLFPRHSASSGPVAYEDHEKLELPPHLDSLLSSKKKKSKEPSDSVSVRRLEVLQCVLELVRVGHLPLEAEEMSPEDAMERYGELMVPIIRTAPSNYAGASTANNDTSRKTNAPANHLLPAHTTAKRSPSPPAEHRDLEGDDFFESD